MTPGGFLDGLGRASLSGGAALLVAGALCGFFPRLPGSVRAWIWRLAFLKLLLSLFWTAPVVLRVLPAPPIPAAPAPVTPWSREMTIPAPAAAEPTRILPGTFAPARGAYPVEAFPEPVADRPAPVPAVTESPRPPAFPVRAALLAAWLLGALLFTLRIAGASRRAARLRRESCPLDDARVAETARRLADRMDLGRLPELRETAGEGPLLLGLRRPAILLPEGFADRVTEAELRMALAHELAHVRRADLAWSMLASLATGLFWFHPLAWLARRELRLAQEMACDEAAVRATGAAPGDYGQLLVRLAVRTREGDWHPGTALAVEPGAALERRLVMLRHVYTRAGRWGRCAGSAGLVLALLGLVPWQPGARLPAASAAQEPVPPPAPAVPAGAVPAPAPPTAAPVPAPPSTVPVPARTRRPAPAPRMVPGATPAIPAPHTVPPAAGRYPAAVAPAVPTPAAVPFVGAARPIVPAAPAPVAVPFLGAARPMVPVPPATSVAPRAPVPAPPASPRTTPSAGPPPAPAPRALPSTMPLPHPQAGTRGYPAGAFTPMAPMVPMAPMATMPPMTPMATMPRMTPIAPSTPLPATPARTRRPFAAPLAVAPAPAPVSQPLPAATAPLPGGLTPAARPTPARTAAPRVAPAPPVAPASVPAAGTPAPPAGAAPAAPAPAPGSVSPTAAPASGPAPTTPPTSVTVPAPRPAPAAGEEAGALWEDMLLLQAARYLRLTPAQVQQLVPLARTADDRLAAVRQAEAQTAARLRRIAERQREALLAGRTGSAQEQAAAIFLRDSMQRQRLQAESQVVQQLLPKLARLLTPAQAERAYLLALGQTPENEAREPALLDPPAGFVVGEALRNEWMAGLRGGKGAGAADGSRALALFEAQERLFRNQQAAAKYDQTRQMLASGNLPPEVVRKISAEQNVANRKEPPGLPGASLNPADVAAKMTERLEAARTQMLAESQSLAARIQILRREGFGAGADGFTAEEREGVLWPLARRLFLSPRLRPVLEAHFGAGK